MQGSESRGPRPKGGRSMNWTKLEVLCLVDWHSRVEEKATERLNRGFAGMPPMTAKMKYEQIAAAVSHTFPTPGRTYDQCRTKWENLQKEYKAIKDYSKTTGSGDYWQMNIDDRREAARTFPNLPINGDRVIFNAVDNHKIARRGSDVPRSLLQDTDDNNPDVGSANSDYPSTLNSELPTAAANEVGMSSASASASMDESLGFSAGIGAPSAPGAPGAGPSFDPSHNTGKRKRKSSSNDVTSLTAAMERGSSSMVEALTSQGEGATKAMDSLLQVDKERLEVQKSKAEDKRSFQNGLLDVMRDLVGALRDTNTRL